MKILMRIHSFQVRSQSLLCAVFFLLAAQSKGQAQIQLDIQKSPDMPAKTRQNPQPKVEKSKNCSQYCQLANRVQIRIEEAFKKEGMTPEKFAQLEYAPSLQGINIASDEIESILKTSKKSLSKEAIDALLVIWGAAVQYDTSGTIGVNIEDSIEIHLKAIKTQVFRYLKNPSLSPISKKKLKEIKFALSLVEDELTGVGNDPGAE